jgi:hypothetical protein
LLAAVLAAATLYGLLAESAYRVADDVAAQGRGQDLLTLAAVPVLLWAGGHARDRSARTWCGSVYSSTAPTPTRPTPSALPLALAVERAARLVGVSRSSMYAAVQRGDVETTRLNGRTVVLTVPLLQRMGIDIG